MKVPAGMTEQQVTKIINKILDFWAHIKVPSFTYEDMRQEGWVHALDGLPRFDAEPTERNLFNFLTRHISNRLLYLKRVKEGTCKIPCRGCPFADREDCKLGEKHNCEAWVNWNRKFERRKSYELVIEPEEYEHNHLYEINFQKNFDEKEAMRKIFDGLTPDMRADLLKILDGVYVNTGKRFRLQERIREILGNTVSEYE